MGLYGGRLIPRSVVENNNSDLTSAYRYINEKGGIVAGIGLTVSSDVTGDVWNAVNPAWRETLIANVIQTLVYFQDPMCIRSNADNSLTNRTYNETASITEITEAQDQITYDLLPQLEQLTPGGGAYLNEGDFQQPEWEQVFYGINYDALNAVKNIYDPFHLFYAKTAVGSEYWVEQNDGRLCKA